jgi:4-hydroxy-L-threonine phosphate dehydrogenase PdxA
MSSQINLSTQDIPNILSDIFNAKDHLMLLVSNDLRIGVVTGHIPLNKVSASLTQELIFIENPRSESLIVL